MAFMKKIPTNVWQVKDKTLLKIILCREGGRTTSEIMDLLLEYPYNKNQLSEILGVNYNTITYHLKIVCKNNYMEEIVIGNKYYYEPTPKLKNSLEDYNIIKENLYKLGLNDKHGKRNNKST